MSNQYDRDDDAAEGDNDFDYDDKKGNEDGDEDNDDKKTKKMDNQYFDEAIELSDEGSEIASNDEEEQESPEHNDSKNDGSSNIPQARGDNGQYNRPANLADDDEKLDRLPNEYNPDDYKSLDVASEIQELFTYIGRYKPINIELDSKLKAFIPEYIPSVGEVDAFLKPSRADGSAETLGLTTIDEPSLNQSKKSALDLKLRETRKVRRPNESAMVVHSIENAEKNPKEISAWIQDVSDVHKTKQPPSVVYSKPFPDFEKLMDVWPAEIEDALPGFKLPTEEIDLDLKDYCKLACNLVDIPVHNTTTNRNIIESLHVYFTLYSEFKANAHFQPKEDQYVDGYINNS